MNTGRRYACVIAGSHSGVGKTTWALSLMSLARKKSLSVQPFKAGPDYIDPGFHDRICYPLKSRNLDLFLQSSEKIVERFGKLSSAAEFSMVEGVMGLFDGKDAEGGEGSTAQIAKLLNLPVFLVLDASAMATSAAAIALGFQKYDPDLKLAGIFFNRINSEGHFLWLKTAVERKTGIPCLGYLPPDREIHLPERHLGLVTAPETQGDLPQIKKASELLDTRIDWEKFMQLCAEPETGVARRNAFTPPPEVANKDASARIAVAYDSAFSFYYEDNFELLRSLGAEIIFFSPLRDQEIPEGAGLVYLGGGFPEMYAAALSSNMWMIEAVQNFHRRGGYLYAECGGFIYLTEAFRDSQGKNHPLVGIIPGYIEMAAGLQHFGYHELEAAGDTFLFDKGSRLRSHEFHYSIWHAGKRPPPPVYVSGGRTDGAAGPQLVASYQHLFFDEALAGRMVQAAAAAGLKAAAK